jgi:hypothetical protein
LQYEKHSDPRISTWHGIEIDRTFEFENAYDWIRFSDDDGSNEMDESDSQDEKHDDPTIFIKCGITTSSGQSKTRINWESIIPTRKWS